MTLRNIFLLGLLLTMPAFAAQEERKGAVQIEADQAAFDEKSGITVLTGNVVISQGSMLITADKVTTYRKNDKLIRIISEGSPAQYQQTNSAGKDPVVAKASEIDYLLSDELIELRGAAHLLQGGSTFSGEEITYNLKNDAMSASGSESGQRRIRLIIDPELQKATESEGDAQ